tara:strand:+ start:217 stop:441 length:225 start_codon:yes stop_codon:yes gene_type:complete
MKSKNIPAEKKSKSLKETREEINDILNKLEKKETDLEVFTDEYKKLLHLNNHVDALFKKKFKEISSLNKKIKKR